MKSYIFENSIFLPEINNIKQPAMKLKLVLFKITMLQRELFLFVFPKFITLNRTDMLICGAVSVTKTVPAVEITQYYQFGLSGRSFLQEEANKKS